ncbi:MAG TPA: peptide-methionine (S)-S-oxide reductase MsrA [Verrucomicrobiae bacterium]|nr:peptide-methionine (S)-S-oxide reductase MsrA [Verrucomicrobiae bacterium]
MSAETRTATLAGGCFWCIEAVFRRLRGVETVVSGYTGGSVPHPTYEEVCRGDTGHAEGVRITFDPQVISFETLLEVFWRVHDPTTLNRQGADVGRQYRSAIFYRDEEQRRMAERSLREAEAAGIWKGPFVTEISPAGPFYDAEEYHQEYYDANRTQGYCRLVIDPKIARLQKGFPQLLKE